MLFVSYSSLPSLSPESLHDKAYSLLIGDPDFRRRLEHRSNNADKTSARTKLEHLLAGELAGVDRMSVRDVAGQDLSVSNSRCVCGAMIAWCPCLQSGLYFWGRDC